MIILQSRLEQENSLLNLLNATEAYVRVLVIESTEYIREIRNVLPNADITVVVADDINVDKRMYDDLGIHWLHEDYLSKILSIKKESFDVIIGEELFLKSPNPNNTALDMVSYLSETGYLVTSFRNAVYWQIIRDMMNGHFYHSLVRIFTPNEMVSLLGNADFQDVAFMPVSASTTEGIDIIEKLVSMGFDNTSNILSVQTWGIKAKKFRPDVMALKSSFDKKIRWDLVTLLRRVEHGIQPIANTVEVLNLIDNEKIQLSYISTYIFRNINYVGQFISNFVPGFYQVGRVAVLRELLGNLEEVYQGYEDFETVSEWKKCVDVLEVYPDEMFPTDNSNSAGRYDNTGVAPEKKVAFIACVNDEDWYHEWQLYINNLEVPDDMYIEIVPVRGATSMCQGYNIGMKQTNAKYKVYLHQDVLVCNKNIIRDMLNIFADSTIGVIGVIGAQTLPPSGMWWETSRPVGRVFQVNDPENIMKTNCPDFSGDSFDVEAVDGLLIATQVDIKWREDLLTGWHFYDISQCKEMQRHGYRVVVPQQNNFWCIHCPPPKILDEEYEKYRRIFIREYGAAK